MEDKVAYEGFEFTVKALKGLRISMIKVQKLSTSKPAEEAPSAATETEPEASEAPARAESKTERKKPKQEPDSRLKRKKQKKKKKKKKPSNKQEGDNGLAD